MISSSKILIFLVLFVGIAYAQIPLTLGQLVTGQSLPASNTNNCYQLTLDDNTVRQVVWWEAGKLLIRLEPCMGRPHLKVSVYGCPSQTKTVYEYMSDKMVNDAIAQGLSSTIPAAWEWPGDVETLTIDITHKTYYIEVGNLNRNGYVASQYQLYTGIFDANGTTVGQPHSKEDIFPLKYMSSKIWDRTVSRDNGSDSANSFSFGGGATSNIVTLDFNPPGLPGQIAQAAAILKKSYEYSFFIREITSSIGTSTGIFSAPVTLLCPTNGACVPSNCRSCANDYPNCPKEFLTNCDETTLNIAKLKTALNTSTAPFDSYVKNPANWTAWTVCGCYQTMDQVDATPSFVEGKRGQTPVWFPQAGPQMKTVGNQLQLAVQGLKDDNNNVYLINIVVRDASTTNGTGETAVYEFMTLQMRTPRYETPQLNDTDYAVIIGVSVGLGVCILIFVIVAIFVRHKRKKKLAQRIRMKK